MRSLLVALMLTVGAVAFSGCLGAPEAASDQPRPTAQDDAGKDFPEMVPITAEEAGIVAPPRIAVYPFEGRITVGAGMPGVGYATPASGGGRDAHIYAFVVEPEAVGIIVELRWADPMTDLDLELAAPGCDTTTGMGPCLFAQGGAPGAGDSPVRFVVTEPAVLSQSGNWTMSVWAKNAANAQFDGVVSVFYGLPPSEDYTALTA